LSGHYCQQSGSHLRARANAAPVKADSDRVVCRGCVAGPEFRPARPFAHRISQRHNDDILAHQGNTFFVGVHRFRGSLSRIASRYVIFVLMRVPPARYRRNSARVTGSHVSRLGKAISFRNCTQQPFLNGINIGLVQFRRFQAPAWNQAGSALPISVHFFLQLFCFTP